MPLGIREAIKRHSTVTIAVVVVIVLGALALAFSNNPLGPQTSSTKAYFTSDDGQSIFVADMSQMPPFEHKGKTAYRVWMFTCDGGKTKFPGYLERLTPAAKQRVEAALAANKKGAAGAPSLAPGDVEVKKPGADNPWVSCSNAAQAAKVKNVTCPGGSGDPDIVMP